MIRLILGIVVGFIAWTILWMGSDAVSVLVSPWYRSQQDAMLVAMANEKPFQADSLLFGLRLVISIIASVLSGFLAVVVSKEQGKTTLILGIVLLLVGIMVQLSVWNYVPIWFHLAFLIMLIPMTIAGGKLKQVA